MKIKSIHVSKLFNEYDYDLDLCEGLTFVHSPNGMGKSTLMRMVYAALRGDVGYLRDTPFERMDIGFDEGSVLIIENYPGSMLVQMRRSEVDTPMSPSDMSQICEAVYIAPDRMLMKRKDGHLAPTLEVFAQELLETIRYAKEHRELEPHPRDDVPDMPDGDLEFWCKDLKAKLDFIKDAGFEPDIPAGKKFPPSRYEIGKDRAGYEELACSVADYVERNYLLAESIIIYKDVVNEIFINKTITVSDTGKIGVSMNNGTALQVQKLSSGEKQILVLFYALLFHAPQGSVVILDEPEISLHVSWQQKLGDYFRDICRVRGIQMIVATHSPQIIHDKWDSARELRPSDA
ncbi:MAG: AAA family ATPase [Thermoplasmata archaeon]|nr:AAA family ATPase [Thermoplasmata archaeon]